MSEISRKTWCGGCGEIAHRHHRQTIVFNETAEWAVYACSNPSCNRALGIVLKIGTNWNKKDTMVGDTYVLTKDYFGMVGNEKS